MYFFFKTY